MERSYSWIKPDIDNIIGKKCVDLSLIENGETGIPLVFQQYFDAVNKQRILRGTKKKISLNYFGLKYSAFIKNVAHKDSKSNSYKITGMSKEFREILQQKFDLSYQHLKLKYIEKHNETKKKSYVKLPEELEEYIVFYKTGKPFEYRVEFEYSTKELTEIEKDIYSINIEENLIKDGALKKILTNQYERNPKNRLKAIKIHGSVCAACGFDFEKVYGELGRGYIEIHHKIPVSHSKEVKINPEEDLVPLCSNCHRMIHRDFKKMMTVEDLKKLLKNKK